MPKNLKEIIIEPIDQDNQIKEPEQKQKQLLKQSSPEPEQTGKKMNFSAFDETDEDIPMSNASESAPTSDERVIVYYFWKF